VVFRSQTIGFRSSGTSLNEGSRFIVESDRQRRRLRRGVVTARANLKLPTFESAWS
jgi:hypothetical protein